MTLIALGHPIHYIIIGEESAARQRAEVIQEGVKTAAGVELPLWIPDSLDVVDSPTAQWFVALASGAVAVTEEVARRVVGGRAVTLKKDLQDWELVG